MSSICLCSYADRRALRQTYPIQKKYQTPEYLRTMPHLRPRTPFNSAVLRFRSLAIQNLTEFFATRDFVQTHPPVITSSDCEGAGEAFTVAPANEEVKAGETSLPFFRDPKYLTVSAQLHLEALAQSVGNVWTLSPTFRAERSDTSRHLSEFYMLEAEMAFVNRLDGIMDLTEAMVRHLATHLYENPVTKAFRFGNGEKSISESSVDRVASEEVEQRWKGLTAAPWARLTYTEAVDILKSDEQLFQQKPRWGDGLQSEHERHIARVVGKGSPVFVTHYPRQIKAFYMRPTAGDVQAAVDPGVQSRETVDCFDLLVPDLCEIAGGSMREHRLSPLLDAMKRHVMVTPSLGGGKHPDPDTHPRPAGSLDWYVDLRRWGCPPHGGFGLGFDRLIAYMTGVRSIRDTVTFPRWYGRCDC